MAVHVDELHTDVVPAPGAGSSPGHPDQGVLGADAERWRELCEHTERRTARTASEAFDD